MRRIDIAFSVLSTNTNDIDLIKEEFELRREIAQYLNEKGYQRFVIAGSELISDNIKDKLSERMDKE